nr:NPC intracellular cholesterol transporter 2 homolog a-like [Dermatophagoides farinae]
MSSIYIFVIVIGLIMAENLVKSQSVNFIDCGEGNVKDVRIFPCMENINNNNSSHNNSLCVIELGTNVTVEADFVAPTNTDKLFEVIKGVIRGREMPFPQQQIDPCNSGNIIPSCPLKKNELYQFKAWFEVKPYYPPISLKVSYMLTDPTEQKIACVQVATKIVDPKKRNIKSNQANRSLRNRMKKNRQKKLKK